MFRGVLAIAVVAVLIGRAFDYDVPRVVLAWLSAL